MHRYKIICLLMMICMLGCYTKRPQKTSLELQAIQAREFETTKKIAFASVLSVFQDLGYVVSSAELETGFITAKSPTEGGFQLFVGNVMKDTKATAFIEELQPGKTKIRLNFVDSKETSSGYGMKSSNDNPIEDPLIYQNAFSKIQEAIFIRSSTN
jgi:hypothetical protein